MDIEWTREKLTRYLDLIRLGFDGRLTADYVSLLNGTTSVRAFYAEASKGTSDTLRKLSRDQILTASAPAPPLEEQSRIAERVGALNEMSGQSEQQVLAAQSLCRDLGAAVAVHIALGSQGASAA